MIDSAHSVLSVVSISDLLSDDQVRSAFEFFETHASDITDIHAAICRIPAPPFGEALRAAYVRDLFHQSGLTNAHIDSAGNVVALRRGVEDDSARPLVVASAHLDTVFPLDTDWTVRREGAGAAEILRAPGIADDGCGLAALIALLRALEECKIKTLGSLLFVATVGEEGAGDLRGARHLLTGGEWTGRIDAFVSLDGSGMERITHRALGSRRYRVTLSGAGGHSWGDFGTANPVHAMSRVVARLVTYRVPPRPRTTLNVGRIEGGTSVNVIPSECAIEVDLRSESSDELNRIDAFFRRAVQEAIEEENAARRSGTPALASELQLIGDRPTGETPATNPIVRLAEDATRALGFRPYLDCASTDANIAISIGVPAITVGAGGSSGNSHTLDEWYAPAGRALGLQRALLVLLGLTGLRGR